MEPDEDAPEYLRKALVSEIDLIRDSMSVISLFTSHFFDTALMAFANFDRNAPDSPKV